MIGTILYNLRKWRREQHMAMLRARGLKIGEQTSIMDGVFLDPSHCFLISIGSHCTLAPCVRVLAHDASMNRHLGITRIGAVTIQDHCFLGDSTLVLPGVTIGAHSIIGARSVVTRNIPPYSLAVGHPARVVGTLEEFLSKHRVAAEEGRIFPIIQYGIENITEPGKQEVIAWVNAHQGYLGGRDQSLP